MLLEKVDHLWKWKMENGAFENSEINMRGSWNQVIKTIAEMLREEE